jgi:hypothetical protein
LQFDQKNVNFFFSAVKFLHFSSCKSLDPKLDPDLDPDLGPDLDLDLDPDLQF